MRSCLLFVMLTLLTLLTSCAEPNPLECGFLDNAEEVASTVVSIDYHPETFVLSHGEVLGNDGSWQNAVARWSTDWGLIPDFDRELVYLYRWIDNGCDAQVSYAAWHAGDKLRLVALEEPCEAEPPSVESINVDLILVEHHDATDIAWCAAIGTED